MEVSTFCIALSITQTVWINIPVCRRAYRQIDGQARIEIERQACMQACRQIGIRASIQIDRQTCDKHTDR